MDSHENVFISLSESDGGPRDRQGSRNILSQVGRVIRQGVDVFVAAGNAIEATVSQSVLRNGNINCGERNVIGSDRVDQ